MKKIYSYVIVLMVLICVLVIIEWGQSKASLSLKSYDPQGNSILFSNNGVVTLDKIEVFLDDKQINITSGVVPAGSMGEIILTNMPMAGTHTIRVVANGATDSMQINVPETWLGEFRITNS